MANLFFAISFCFIAMLNFYLVDGYDITANDFKNRNRKLATPVLNPSQSHFLKSATPNLNSSFRVGGGTAAAAAAAAAAADSGGGGGGSGGGGGGGGDGGGGGGDGSDDSSAAAAAAAAGGGGAASAAAAAAAAGGGTGTSKVVSSNIPHGSTVENGHQNHNLNPSQPYFSKSATPNLNSSFSVGGGDGGSSGAAAAAAAASSGSGGSSVGASSASGTGSNNVVSPYNNIPHKRAFGKEMINHSADHFAVNHPDNVA